ncbi:BTB/POZ and MATH domain-containing protein 3-like [Papaver somniferum]|uniref:BTB/POZ and MATH domain-containing protein 3-like n=1 Tax=Papaver somniferum TaxID=3469 RepID=UPI000E6FE40C|nr:BTB/POZ and MATH domain-containing protein 3-like [Papaver somniferum]XP_026411464.1 BTB/POZ and MATH domain-containing protein 3-like [Papaver somniferum]XP_026411465.1 BTB/POZ and MATH domain-containing protein 3-like [Papaver somniferum]
MSSSHLFYETVQGFHEFEINGYSLMKGIGVGEYKSSGIFTVGGYDWKIRFFPDGDDQASEDYVSVFIELASPGEVGASVEFKLLDQCQEGQSFCRTTSPHMFNTGCSTWGFKKCMERSELETSNYVKDDRLCILGTVSMVQTRFEEGKRHVIPVPPSDMIQNIKGLLESEVGSDITFHIGSEEFRAHKSILAARSPVFKAMFYGQMGNPDMETTVIEEFDPFAFKAMLLFLYSDELPEAHKLSDSDSVCTFTLMQHLLAAADRFDLARLKLMCEEKLCEDMIADTVADTLFLAERYQCQELKNVCLNFAAKPDNLGEVMKSDGYSRVEKCSPSLLTDLLKKCMRL